MILWGGYHRTYAVIRQGGVEALGVPPVTTVLVTVMTGIPEVEDFLAGRSFLAVRERALGDRPPLLRDFFDDNLAISVNLRKKKYQAQIERMRNNKIRIRTVQINAD